MDFTSFITDNLLSLVPAIYVVGIFIKRTESISDKYIPLILLSVSIVLALLLNGFTTISVVQGILVAGASVLSNEIIKQVGRE